MSASEPAIRGARVPVRRVLSSEALVQQHRRAPPLRIEALEAETPLRSASTRTLWSVKDFEQQTPPSPPPRKVSAWGSTTTTLADVFGGTPTRPSLHAARRQRLQLAAPRHRLPTNRQPPSPVPTPSIELGERLQKALLQRARSLQLQAPLVVLIEVGCSARTHPLRTCSITHDAHEYQRRFEAVRAGLGQIIRSQHGFELPLECAAVAAIERNGLDVVATIGDRDSPPALPINKAYGASPSSRLGAFEVYLVANGVPELSPRCRLLHSKLASRRWPSVATLAHACEEALRPAFERMHASVALGQAVDTCGDDAAVLKAAVADHGAFADETVRARADAKLSSMWEADNTLKAAVVEAKCNLNALRLVLSDDGLQSGASREGVHWARCALASLEGSHRRLCNAIAAKPVEATTLARAIEAERGALGPCALISEAIERLELIREADAALHELLPRDSPPVSSAGGGFRIMRIPVQRPASEVSPLPAVATPSVLREASAFRARLRRYDIASASVRYEVAARLAQIEHADAALLGMLKAYPPNPEALLRALGKLVPLASPSVQRRVGLALSPVEAADAAIRRAVAAGHADDLASVIESEGKHASRVVLGDATDALTVLRADDALRSVLVPPLEASKMREVLAEFEPDASPALVLAVQVGVRKAEAVDVQLMHAVARLGVTGPVANLLAVVEPIRESASASVLAEADECISRLQEDETREQLALAREERAREKDEKVEVRVREIGVQDATEAEEERKAAHLDFQALLRDTPIHIRRDIGTIDDPRDGKLARPGPPIFAAAGGPRGGVPHEGNVEALGAANVASFDALAAVLRRHVGVRAKVHCEIPRPLSKFVDMAIKETADYCHGDPPMAVRCAAACLESLEARGVDPRRLESSASYGNRFRISIVALPPHLPKMSHAQAKTMIAEEKEATSAAMEAEVQQRRARGILPSEPLIERTMLAKKAAMVAKDVALAAEAAACEDLAQARMLAARQLVEEERAAVMRIGMHMKRKKKKRAKEREKALVAVAESRAITTILTCWRYWRRCKQRSALLGLSTMEYE